MISNIGTSSIVGKIFNPIVTTLSFEELQTIYNGGQYLPISNSVLFSIPQDSDGNDLEYEGSIWLTDKNGYLYPMTPKYSTVLRFENFMETYIANNTVLNYKITSISWLNTLESSSISTTNPLLSSNNKIYVVYDNGSTGYLDINEYLLNFEVYTNDMNRAGIKWYTNPGTYYIKAVIPSFRCKNNSDVYTTNKLTFTIYSDIDNNENNNENNNGNNNGNNSGNNSGNNDGNNDNNNGNNGNNDSSTYYYWYIGVDNPSSVSDIQSDNTVGGWHKIGTSLSGFILDTNNDQVHISDTRVPYYIVIPNNLNIYDSLDDPMEYSFDTVTCNISGYKAYKWSKEKSGSIFDGVRIVIGVILKS